MQRRRHAAAAIIVVLVGAVGCRTTTPPQVTLPPPDQRAPDSTRAPTGLVPAAAISGFVADAGSGEPLEGALVVLSAIDRDDQRIALTDDRGYYELIQLPAGTYAVRASSTGYVGRALRQRRLLQGGRPIELMDGERLQEVNFRLRLGGTISGRILDADERPVALAQAQALRPQFQDGERVLVALGTALSNSRGEFRILSLPPGDYYVSAFDPAAQGAVDESGELQYAPTFYPGVISPADARRVRLEAAGEVSGVELSLQFIAPVTVSGRMVSEDGRPLLSAAVVISAYAGVRLAVGPAIRVRVTPDGGFEFTNVPPGHYIIRARGDTERGGPSLFASFQVLVEDQDVSNIRMALGPGAQLSGQLEFDSPSTMSPADLTRILVSAPMVDGTMFGGEPRGEVQLDGSFHLDSVQAGERFVRVDSLPETWSLKAVYYRGRDVTDILLELDKGDHVRDLRLVLTDRLTGLTGTVRNQQGEIVTDRTVVALPVDSTLWRPRGRHVRLAYLDLNGRYQIQGLPAGAYLVAAVEEIDESELYDREALERVAALGVSVTLREGDITALDLKVGNPGSQLAP